MVTEEKKEAATEKKPKKKSKAVAQAGGFFKDFKTFISKGNIMQLAIAFIMGVAFTAIVNSLVDDIIMQFFALIFGKNNIDQMAFTISGTPIYYGRFIMAVIKFLLIALVLFFIIKAATKASKGFKKLKKGEEPPPPPAPVPLTASEQLLTDIKELLKKNQEGAVLWKTKRIDPLRLTGARKVTLTPFGEVRYAND